MSSPRRLVAWMRPSIGRPGPDRTASWLSFPASGSRVHGPPQFPPMIAVKLAACARSLAPVPCMILMQCSARMCGVVVIVWRGWMDGWIQVASTFGVARAGALCLHRLANLACEGMAAASTEDRPLHGRSHLACFQRAVRVRQRRTGVAKGPDRQSCCRC